MNPNDKSKMPEWLTKKYAEKPASPAHPKIPNASKPSDAKPSIDRKISLVKNPSGHQ